MFLGHFAVAMAAKAVKPKISLGLLFFAAQFLDLLWPVLVLTGVETVSIEPGNTTVTPLNFTSYPYSHSLLMVFVWALLLGIGYAIIKKRRNYGVLIAVLVFSHWVLDFLTHKPDLPLYPGDNHAYGLGLWNSFYGTLITETILFCAGVFLYVRTTLPATNGGAIWLWVLTVLLLIVHFANFFGPPPPDVSSIAWAGQLQWLFVLLAWYADKKRKIRSKILYRR